MDVRDAFHLTGASIRTHKLRSVLAAIGVVLGIGAVIGVVTMGAGFQESILGTFTEQFSADLLSVGVESQQTANGPPTRPNVFAFTDRDLAAIAALPGVAEVDADIPVPQATVKLADGEDFPGAVVQATYANRVFAPLDAGRAPQAETEAVIANATALHLMSALGRGDVLGARLLLTWPDPDGGHQTETVTVVGIQKPSSFFTSETITVGRVFAPLTPMDDGGTTHAWQSFTVRATGADALPDVKTRIQAYLDTQSDAKDRKGDRLVFRYDTQEEVTKLITTAIGQFTGFIGAVGAVALLVGLVGIANIMLVTVQERTREIGVMKATGASRGEVLLVFLVESVAICVVGAVLGIGLGLLMGMGLNQLVGSFSSPSQVPPLVFVWDWYAIAVIMGVVVGLVAGLYPAWRAAKVSPVEALRYE
jgi:putative ABC transport system permease protein